LGKIVHGSLCPHPPIIVPEVGRRELSKVRKTIGGMKVVSGTVAELDPDALVVISPHAPAFSNAVAVNQIPILRGNLRQFGAPEVEFEEENDLDLGKIIIKEAGKRKIPVEVIGAGYLRENRATEVLDHGIMVPLYYFREAGIRCPLVPISISFLSLEQMYFFGVAIREAVEKSCKKVAVVASGDLSHRLLPTAPAGYDPQGRVFDEKVLQAVKKADPAALISLPEELVERAGQCGLRSLIMLMGAFEGYQVRSIVHSYEGPFGVGYLVAEFFPEGPSESRNFLSRLFAGDNEKKHEPSYPVKLAIDSLRAYLLESRIIPVPEDIPKELTKPAGTFVSLKKHGRLRGCIGTMRPTRKNAAEEIIMNAISAAIRDPRFEPVSPEELEELEVSVDILGEPQPIRSLDELDPKRFGVIVRKGARTGLLLPDIEGVNTIDEQLNIAKQKAGISLFEDCEIERFEVVRYK